MIIVEEAPSRVERAVDRVEKRIQQRPDESMLLALAAGAVVGLAIGGMFARSGGRRDRWLSRDAAANVGERVMASLDKVIPESLSNSLGLK